MKLGARMYRLYKVRDVVRIPPNLFGMELQEAALRVLTEKYVGSVDSEMGIIIAVFNVEVEEEGQLLPGDGATYHTVTYEILAFKPSVREIVEGTVINATQYGAWINIGPVEGLVHVSQMMDEHVRFDPQRKAFIGENSKRVLELGDTVRARVVSLSLTPLGGKPRIQLTMRQPYLGKLEWIEKQREKEG